MTSTSDPQAPSSAELAELPVDHRTRWIAARKAQVVRAVEAGLIGIDEALSKYRLSLTEFRQWQYALQSKGLAGLRSTHARIGKIARGRKRKHRKPALTPA